MFQFTDAEREQVLAHACARTTNWTDVHYEYKLLVLVDESTTSWTPAIITALSLCTITCQWLRPPVRMGLCSRPCAGEITKRVAYFLWAFFNGWADALSYRRYKGFATMMVGNMAFLGMSLVTSSVCGHDPTFFLSSPMFYIILILLFVTGAFSVPLRRDPFGNMQQVWFRVKDACTGVHNDFRIICFVLFSN